MPARMFGQMGVADTIRADSVVRWAPVSTLTELLNGRLAGLWTQNGTIQARGASSLLEGREPLVIVDGVRFGSEGTAGVLTFGAPTAGSLDDLDPNSIATIEFVSGVSATARYGPDALNGALILTTRRGEGGPLRANLHARAFSLSVPQWDRPVASWGWNSTSPSVNCFLALVSAGFCAQDSVTARLSAFDDPDYSPLHGARTLSYGGDVSGGRGALRYFFGADLLDASPPIRTPSALEKLVAADRGLSRLPDELSGPSNLTRLNLHGNVGVQLGARVGLTITGGYIRNRFGSPLLQPWQLVGTPDDQFYPDPLVAQAGSSNDDADRFLGTVAATWNPVPWLRAHALAGHSSGDRDLKRLVRREFDGAGRGYVSTSAIRDRASTIEIGATATARTGRVSVRTTVVGQYVRLKDDAKTESAVDLAPGATTSEGAGTIDWSLTHTEGSEHGVFVSQTVGLNDRLFVTGGLRVDRIGVLATDLVDDARPHVGVSWVVSDEPFVPAIPGGGRVVLRYGYGETGRPTVMAITQPIGFPALAPMIERVNEHELGADLSTLHDRFRLSATWYRRHSAIESDFAPSYAGSRDHQHGLELSLDARVLETKATSWSIGLLHTLRRSNLTESGAMAPFLYVGGGLVEGYSVGARFAPKILGYSDANGDGIITIGEIQRSAPAYVGESIPPSNDVFSTAIGLLGNRLRISAMVERRSGFTWLDSELRALCWSGSCRGAVDADAPIQEKLEAVAMAGDPAFGITRSGDFTRLREVSVAFNLPDKIARAVFASAATVTLAGRNVALLSGNGLAEASTYGYPQPRAWTLRIDLDR